MKGPSAQILRIVVVAAIAWIAYVLLDPYGLGWLLLPAAVAVAAVTAGRRWMRGRGARALDAAEARWGAAVLYPPARARAIDEVEAALAAADPADRARLSVLIAELLAADGRAAEAEPRLAALTAEPLDAFDAGIVRHARASLALRSGENERAAELLASRPPRTGSDDLDQRLALLEAAVDCELGRGDRALDTATRIRRSAGDDDGIAVEARVVRAAALDALGERNDALKVLRSLEPDVVDALLTIGFPRVRALAESVRGDRSGSGGRG